MIPYFSLNQCKEILNRRVGQHLEALFLKRAIEHNNWTNRNNRYPEKAFGIFITHYLLGTVIFARGRFHASNAKPPGRAVSVEETE